MHAPGALISALAIRIGTCAVSYKARRHEFTAGKLNLKIIKRHTVRSKAHVGLDLSKEKRQSDHDGRPGRMPRTL